MVGIELIVTIRSSWFELRELHVPAVNTIRSNGLFFEPLWLPQFHILKNAIKWAMPMIILAMQRPMKL